MANVSLQHKPHQLMNLSARWGDYGESNYRYMIYSYGYFNKV